MSKFAIVMTVASAAAFFASGGYVIVDPALSAMSSTFRSTVSNSCTIKGNIQIGTGKHIYHVPGQAYYDETVISPMYGERWFCSEAEARAAGWVKSKV